MHYLPVLTIFVFINENDTGLTETVEEYQRNKTDQSVLKTSQAKLR